METLITIGGKIGEGVLSASVEALLGKLSSTDLVKYAWEGQVLQEFKRWESMLKRINAVLDDAEEKQMTSELVKTWVDELRDLTYDVEDILDEFATEALSRKLAKESQSSPSKLQKLNPFRLAGKKAKTVEFNVKLGSKFEEITPRLQKIVAYKNDLLLKESDGKRTKQVRERPPTTSLVNEAEVHGRDEDKKLILELLKAETSDTEVPGIISIVGMGGIGKSTLAQLIFNDPSLEFDFKSWVFVGEDFDVFTITQTLLQEDSRDLNSLQIKLKNKLSGQKFLIVLDDVWNEDYEKWVLCRAPFEAGAAGSKIIITTRNHSVSSLMGIGPAYLLKGLSNDDCLTVLAHHALGARNFGDHMDLKEAGEAIVSRCQGLPLAAKVIGGLLRGKPYRSVWEDVLESSIWNLPEGKGGILPALRLSYHHLPSHLKRCFVYCAIFPKGYEFCKTEMVLLWMAEGFLQQTKKNKHMEDLGHEYFDDLLSRSFFQQSSRDSSRYVMHDLTNDLARCSSGESCFNLDEKMEEPRSYEKVRHSSFTCHRFETSKRFEVFYQMYNLRTFLALPDISSWHHYLTSKVLHDLVPKFKCLMVLSLASYCLVELPSSIGSLRHLRYLDLSYTEIERLPESVSKLVNLQTLRLCGCEKLVELPLRICNLINLEYLDINGTKSLQKMPQQIGNLKNLRSLAKFIVGGGNGVGIMELMKLSCLRGKLHITGLQHVATIRDAEIANLKEKQGLEQLTLEWTDNFDSSQNARDLQVLDSLRPHRNIEALSIISYAGTVFPSWIGDPSFSNMVLLRLQNCRNSSSLPSLGQLPSLRYLTMAGMDGVKKVGVEFCGNAHGSLFSKAFSGLESLHIMDMLEWEQWSWSNDCSDTVGGSFPVLQVFSMRNCPKLVGSLPSYLPSLEKLSIGVCQAGIFRNVRDLSSLKTLEFWSISSLVNLPQELIQALDKLEVLEISFCEELMYLWQNGAYLDKLASLKSLKIFSCPQLVSLVEGDQTPLPCSLEILDVQGCHNLEKLPNMLHSCTSLKQLIITGASKLVSFPETGLPCSLKEVTISNCGNLESLPEGMIGCDNSCNAKLCLDRLSIGGCPLLTPILIGKCPNSLRSFSTNNCTTQLLESLQNGLTHLSISDSLELKLFPERELPIPTLTHLYISNCDNLRSLPKHMQNLTALQSLEIKDCPSLRSFPDGGLPTNLKSVTIRDCEYRTQPMSDWGLHRLTSLTWLLISGTGPSTNMVSFPDDDGLLLPTSLVKLVIERLDNLQSISRGIQKLSSLREVSIRDCPKLQYLPKEGFPATLESLRIMSCPLLAKRCARERGEYWPIISHIPGVHLDCLPYTVQKFTL